jgi:hypothetical protein
MKKILRFSKLALLVASLMGLSSCGGGGGGSPTANTNTMTASATMATGVVVVNNQTTVVVSSDTNSVTFAGSPATITALQPGSVLTVGNDARKVVSMTTVNGNTVVQTSTPSIDEVFSKIDISGQVALTSKNIDSTSIAPGVQIVSSAPTNPVVGILTPSFSQDNFSVTIQNEKVLDIDVNGVIKFGKPLLKVDYHRERLTITSADVHFTSNADVDLNLTAAQSFGGSTKVKLFAFSVPIGTTPFNITIPVYLKLDAALNGEIAIGFTDAAVMDVRVSTQAPGYQLTVANNSTNSFAFKTPTLKTSLTLGAYIQPNIQLRFGPFDLGGIENQIGASATGTPIQDFGGQFMNCIHITSDANASATAYFPLPVNPGRVQADIFNKSWTIYDGGMGINGVCSLSISSASTTIQQGGVSQLQAVVTDVLNNPVLNVPTLQWSSQNTAVATVTYGLVTGVGPGSTTITVLDTNSGRSATATVTITPIPAPAPTPTCVFPQVLQNGVCVTPTLTCTPPQVLQNGVCVTPTIADTTKPIVSVFNVTPGSLTAGGSFTIAYTVSDAGGSGLWQAQLWRAPDNGGVAGAWTKITTTTLSGNGPVSGSFTDAPTAGTSWYGVHGVDNAVNIGVEPSPAKVVVNTATGTLTVNGFASSYLTTTTPYQPTISLTGSGLNSVTQISWNCTMPSGTSCGTITPWTPGSTGWSKFIQYSDTSASVSPTFLVAGDPMGTYNWSVTFTAAGQSVTKLFTVVNNTSSTVPLTVNGFASNYSTTTTPYQPTISLTGSGFNSIVTQISWTCAMPNGTTCSGSPYVWTSANWNYKYIRYSDTSAVVAPMLLTSTDPIGTYNWSVTFSGAGQSVTKSFTVTKY